MDGDWRQACNAVRDMAGIQGEIIMGTKAAIEIGLKWKWRDATGAVCRHCGFTCFLRELVGCLTFSGSNRIQPQDTLVHCASCGDAIQEDV